MKLDLSEELIADIGYVKEYLAALADLKRRYAHTITGAEQRHYIDRSHELIEKISKGIDYAIKQAVK